MNIFSTVSFGESCTAEVSPLSEQAVIATAVETAQKRAAEITADADKKATDITEKARKDAEREYNERLAGLRADVTDIAFDISKKILSREVTDADNMAIADEFFSKYGEKEEKV